MRCTVMFLILFLYCSLAITADKQESTMAVDFSNYLGYQCLSEGHNRGSYPTSSSRFLCTVGTTISPILSLISSLLLTTDTSINGVHTLINAAKPDANAYIASNGKNYHTAKLEAAFQFIKKRYPYANNMQMAKAIVAY